MLKSKKSRQRRKRTGWYTDQFRPHFDQRLTFADAELLVTDPNKVAVHPFLPFISFDKKERKYKRLKDGTSKIRTKTRKLVYTSNKDGYIFAYYASILSSRYETELCNRGLETTVIGYRKGLSNISLANEAFREIASRGSCEVIAIDIRKFFDNIDHTVLKRAWVRLMGGSHLGRDHFAVFRALTQGGTLDRAACLERLGIDKKARDKHLPRPLANLKEFRETICGKSGTVTNLVQAAGRRGIPQGTPISAIAANLSMLEFDEAVHQAVQAVGGSYRRYSDDILIVCPLGEGPRIEAKISLLLSTKCRSLQLADDKTIRVTFLGRGLRVSGTPLQYLGFQFDGCKKLLRPGTVSRYYRRLAKAVALANRDKKRASGLRKASRAITHRRELYAGHSHLGARNFIKSYVFHAARKTGSPDIRRQLSGHFSRLQKLLADAD